jgi:hypothetical protein
MTNQAANHVLSDSSIAISVRSAGRARTGLEFHDGLPIGTVSLTEGQRNARVCVARKEQERDRDWTNVLFTDGSDFWLEADGVSFGGSEENAAMVFALIGKFARKVLVLARFCSAYESNQSNLIRMMLLTGAVRADASLEKLPKGPD